MRSESRSRPVQARKRQQPLNLAELVGSTNLTLRRAWLLKLPHFDLRGTEICDVSKQLKKIRQAAGKLDDEARGVGSVDSAMIVGQ